MVPVSAGGSPVPARRKHAPRRFGPLESRGWHLWLRLSIGAIGTWIPTHKVSSNTWPRHPKCLRPTEGLVVPSPPLPAGLHFCPPWNQTQFTLNVNCGEVYFSFRGHLPVQQVVLLCPKLGFLSTKKVIQLGKLNAGASQRTVPNNSNIRTALCVKLWGLCHVLYLLPTWCYPHTESMLSGSPSTEKPTDTAGKEYAECLTVCCLANKAVTCSTCPFP